jgi:short-subunit dehydrogenase
MRRYAFTGGTAVVTGAASGIGAALAAGLAARGSHVVLLDRDAPGLAAVAARIRAGHPAVRVATHLADLGDAAAVREVGTVLRAAHPETTLLVNNAGIALAGRFDQVTAAEFDAVLAVNLHAVVGLTAALLPVLRANPGSHLVNVSSIFGVVAPAGQTAYAASKFAVRGFTEALRAELAGEVGVTCVHPGGVRTRIAQNVLVGSGVPAAEMEGGLRAWDRLLTLDPAVAAEAILRAVHRRRPRALVGRDAVLLDALARLFPAGTARLLAAGARHVSRP